MTVVLSDDGGTANGGVDTSATQQFSIAIHKLHPWHNSLHAFDVTGNAGQPDGVVSPLDALAVINYVNAFGHGHIPADAVPGSPYLDTVGGLGDHGDDNVAPIDALVVINYLNAFGSASPGPAGEGDTTFETASSSLEPDGDLLMLLAMDVAAQAKRRKRNHARVLSG